MKNNILLGNSEEILPALPDSFVDFVLTGPPYDKAKMAKGYSLDLHLIGEQIKRVLKPNGVCVITLQDAFVKGGKSVTTFRTAVDWSEIMLFWADYVYWRGASKGGYWWDSRPRLEHDYVFVFVNGNKPKTYHKDIVDGSVLDYRFQTVGIKRPKEVSTPFPERLASDMILTYTEPGDLVLDPFAGIGTTCRIAKLQDRNWLGIELIPSIREFALNSVRKAVNGFRISR